MIFAFLMYIIVFEYLVSSINSVESTQGLFKITIFGLFVIRKLKCFLSICDFQLLWIVVRLQPIPAYVEAWNILKITYFIQDYLNLVRILITDFDYLLPDGNTVVLCQKKYHINERHLCLVTLIFTKLSQNVCLINWHILIYRHVRWDYKLWNTF